MLKNIFQICLVVCAGNTLIGASREALIEGATMAHGAAAEARIAAQRMARPTYALPIRPTTGPGLKWEAQPIVYDHATPLSFESFDLPQDRSLSAEEFVEHVMQHIQEASDQKDKLFQEELAERITAIEYGTQAHSEILAPTLPFTAEVDQKAENENIKRRNAELWDKIWERFTEIYNSSTSQMQRSLERIRNAIGGKNIILTQELSKTTDLRKWPDLVRLIDDLKLTKPLPHVILRWQSETEKLPATRNIMDLEIIYSKNGDAHYYHGRQQALHLIHIFLLTLWKMVNLVATDTGFQMMRNWLDPNLQIMSYENLKDRAKKNIADSSVGMLDHEPDISASVIAAVPHLWANSNNWGEHAPYFWYGAGYINLSENNILPDLIGSLGLSKENKAELLTIAYKMPSGVLLQFFMPPEVARKVVYQCLAGGAPCETYPKHFVERPNTLEDKVRYQKDTDQVRIIMDPQVFKDPKKVTIFAHPYPVQTAEQKTAAQEAMLALNGFIKKIFVAYLAENPKPWEKQPVPFNLLWKQNLNPALPRDRNAHRTLDLSTQFRFSDNPVDTEDHLPGSA